MTRQSIPPRSTASPCSATAALAGHLGDQRRAESDEIVERFHDLDSGESGARLAACGRAGERADD